MSRTNNDVCNEINVDNGLYNTINTFDRINMRKRDNFKNFVINACNELKNPPYKTIVFDKEQVSAILKKCDFTVIIEPIEDYFILKRLKC